MYKKFFIIIIFLLAFAPFNSFAIIQYPPDTIQYQNIFTGITNTTSTLITPTSTITILGFSVNTSRNTGGSEVFLYCGDTIISAVYNSGTAYFNRDLIYTCSQSVKAQFTGWANGNFIFLRLMYLNRDIRNSTIANDIVSGGITSTSTATSTFILSPLSFSGGEIVISVLLLFSFLFSVFYFLVARFLGLAFNRKK